MYETAECAFCGKKKPTDSVTTMFPCDGTDEAHAFICQACKVPVYMCFFHDDDD